MENYHLQQIKTYILKDYRIGYFAKKIIIKIIKELLIILKLINNGKFLLKIIKNILYQIEING